MSCSSFEGIVKQDTPRLVVMFRRKPDGGEQFQWGVVGNIPILTLIGAIIRAQTGMCIQDLMLWTDECPQQAFVIAWDDANRVVRYFAHPELPLLACAGMLETAKAIIVNTSVAKTMASEQVVLMPDGSPYRK